MLDITTARQFIAPRRQGRQVRKSISFLCALCVLCGRYSETDRCAKRTLRNPSCPSCLLRKYPFGDENQEARLGSIIPAKAGIQANSAQQTWIPACAGMTSRGGHHVEGKPSIFVLGGRA